MKYILDLIQNATLTLSNEYGWDKTVFENAYQQVLESDFVFKIASATKQSRDKKKLAKLIIEKNKGARVIKPQPRKQNRFHCDTEDSGL